MNEPTLRKQVDLDRIYPARPRNARKGDYGRVLVAGGSDRYAGCLAFNALAALRAGADLAIIIAPRRAADIVAGYSPDLITVACASAFPDPRIVRDFRSSADALVLGCGVVRTREAHKALLMILTESDCPTVADAEALHAIASRPSVCRGKKILLTPNAGEFQVLSGKNWPSSKKERTVSVRTLARQYGATVIVKGAEDYISDGERFYVDHEGSPILTKGGYGDLLAGVAGAILARSQGPFEAAKTAADIVGRAGKIASKRLGESTLASDTLAELPHVLNQRRS